MKTAYLSYSTTNIGDDIQTWALENALGMPDLYLDRDRLWDYENDGDIRLIANGWFIDGPFPPPPNIKVIYVALCLGSLPRYGGQAVKHLKECEPIGCRDLKTLDWCEENDIKCYFSSCPTILLDPDKMPKTVVKNGVVVVDVNPQDLSIRNSPIIWSTNVIHPSVDREESLVNRIKLWRSASLVVTSRLHVAIPCLGLGIPVIPILPEIGDWRFTAMQTFVRVNTRLSMKAIPLFPKYHEVNVESWKRMVRERLLDRVSNGRI